MYFGSQRIKESALTVLTLFTSTGTLICCALPVALVTLGLGATVVGLTSASPWLIVLSRHKLWIFVISALLLAASAWLIYRPGRACPTEPKLARLCMRLDRGNRIVHGIAVAIWSIGFFAAFLLLPLRHLIGW